MLPLKIFTCQKIFPNQVLQGSVIRLEHAHDTELQPPKFSYRYYSIPWDYPYGKFTEFAHKTLLQGVLPLVQGFRICEHEVEALHHGTHRRAHLSERDILACADHRALRERHERVAAREDVAAGHDLARRQRVRLLREPTVWPECVRERRKALGIAVDCVGYEGNLGFLGNKAADKSVWLRRGRIQLVHQFPIILPPVPRSTRRCRPARTGGNSRSVSFLHVSKLRLQRREGGKTRTGMHSNRASAPA